MKNTEKNTAIEKFLGKKSNKNAKKILINGKEGLIERVDKILVTEDGRQLLREQY